MALGWWRLEQEELRGLLAYRGWDPGFWGSSLCKLGRVIFLSTSQFSSLSVGCRWPFPHAWRLDDYRGLGCQWLCDLWGAALMVADISMLRPYKCSFCHCSTSCIRETMQGWLSSEGGRSAVLKTGYMQWQLSSGYKFSHCSEQRDSEVHSPWWWQAAWIQILALVFPGDSRMTCLRLSLLICKMGIGMVPSIKHYFEG